MSASTKGKGARRKAARIDWDGLFAAAGKARRRAHAPYSSFRVGAAVLDEHGRLHAGCNVENASYGLSVCAERSAVARMVASGGREVTAVAIVVDSEQPTPPCGMCRQTIVEFAAQDVPVRSRNLRGAELRRTVGELLPEAFTRRFL